MKTLISCEPFSQRIEEKEDMPLNRFREGLKERPLLGRPTVGLLSPRRTKVRKHPTCLRKSKETFQKVPQRSYPMMSHEGINSPNPLLEAEVAVSLARAGLGRAGGHL